MDTKEKELFKKARKLGYRSKKDQLPDLASWLREEKQIHVEVGSIWDELNNFVESYCYTVTAPICIYYHEPIHAAGGNSYIEMQQQGLFDAILLLSRYEKQKHLKATDDEVVLAYLKGYGDKDKILPRPEYQTNIEKYAYLQGKQGDYIEEGLTEDDILILVRNKKPEEETLKLK
ncbi:hypothetical protein [Salinimicrobium sp. TH3]|uniref:hypothetical protein n=1 Tax=Salinimicrobium sp. TH3 TaxID=2997342 RepID=UPI002274AB8E|nr:hypothetical protein [Salinimicrobium sp. TH3]MCY2687014.1 hypothetical protein [Salinimicrobium sp. TH3]